MVPLHSPVEAARWLRQSGAWSLQADSRQIVPGEAFIAWPGAATDGRRHVGDACRQGAVACLVEAEGVEAFTFPEVPALGSYAGLKAATGPIAAAYYEEPSRQIEVLAVTGTNGKTSTAWWLAEALRRLGRRCALVGTLGMGVPPELTYTGLTTPDPVSWQRALRGFVDEGFAAVAIEASSIGIAERRLDGTRIALAVFTNFTQDHLDYHGSMDAYWQAKAELFRWPGLRAAVVNVDDVHGASLIAELAASAAAAGVGPELWTVSTEVSRADAVDGVDGVERIDGVQAPRLAARDIRYGANGLSMTIVEAGAPPQRLETTLIGQYNVANLLCVIGSLRALGVALGDAVAACCGLGSVPGRMERIDVAGTPLAVVDYAHTPDALDKALAGLRPLAQARGGALWCLFGCGGDRDPIKRPMMAAVAEKQADHLVVTSDNPRSEKPAQILSQILLGLAAPEAAQVQPDRALAIADVLAQAAPADVVLIAGRGHEAWQEVAGERIAFSDRAHAIEALTRRGAA
ncbi:MAG: UDP-N-acetylmuramoyl-L-alanyl-D-glutamate--2,6-diaminopimelate ligase [Variovorax sp.]